MRRLANDFTHSLTEHVAGMQITDERERAEASGGVVVEGKDWVTVTFAEKPDRDILDSLKAAGFRWAKGSWRGRRENLPEGIGG
jgi:uncharacterized protein YidB (DUF937 family)